VQTHTITIIGEPNREANVTVSDKSGGQNENILEKTGTIQK